MLVTLLAAVLSAVAPASHAAPAGYEPGTKIVRVEACDQAQLDALLAMADGIMSETVGIGPIDLLVSPADLAAIDAMGLDATVLVDDVPAQVRAERAQIDAWFKTHPRQGLRGGFTPGDET